MERVIYLITTCSVHISSIANCSYYSYCSRTQRVSPYEGSIANCLNHILSIIMNAHRYWNWGHWEEGGGAQGVGHQIIAHCFTQNSSQVCISYLAITKCTLQLNVRQFTDKPSSN